MRFYCSRSFTAWAAGWMLLALISPQASSLNAQTGKKHNPPGASQPPDPLMPDKPPPDGRRWAGSLTVGFSWESGVNNRVGLNLKGNLLGTFGATSTLFEYDYLFAEQTFCSSEGCLDQTVANDLSGRLSIEKRFDRRFSFLSRTGYKRDTVQNLDFRVEQHFGLGIVVLSNERAFLQLAPGFTLAEEDKDLESDDGFDLGIGHLQFFRLAINSNWSFNQSSSLQKHLDSSDDFLVEGQAGITGKINKRWALNVALIYDHENLVMAGRSKKDQKMTAGLQFKF